MKALYLALALALMPACATVPTSPGQVADLTIVDERVASAVELSYKAARIAAEFAVDTGEIRGAEATRWRTLNQRARDATLAVRTAYRAQNARDFETARAEAMRLIDEILSLTGRNQ